MISATFNAHHYRWMAWGYLPFITMIFGLEGWASGSSGVCRELPWIATMLLSSFDQVGLTLGPHSFAYPVTRRRWLATRILGITGPLTLCIGAWTLGALAGGTLQGRPGLPVSLEGMACTLLLYGGFALGPYLFTAMTTVPATTMENFRPLVVVPYFLLAFVPWGTLGVWASGLGSGAVPTVAVASLLMTGTGLALTLGRLARSDAPGTR